MRTNLDEKRSGVTRVPQQGTRLTGSIDPSGLDIQRERYLLTSIVQTPRSLRAAQCQSAPPDLLITSLASHSTN